MRKLAKNKLDESYIDKLRKKLAKKLEENILDRYYGWEYFEPDIIDGFLHEYNLTEKEKETLLRPLRNLF